MIIETDKYEGHTLTPWTLEHLEDDEGHQWFEVPAVHYTTKQSGDGSQQEYADARLMADAPLLLAEVKRLSGLLDEIADFALNEMESNKEHNLVQHHILMNNIMATALWRTNAWWGKKETRMDMNMKEMIK